MYRHFGSGRLGACLNIPWSSEVSKGEKREMGEQLRIVGYQEYMKVVSTSVLAFPTVSSKVP